MRTVSMTIKRTLLVPAEAPAAGPLLEIRPEPAGGRKRPPSYPEEPGARAGCTALAVEWQNRGQ